MGAMHEAVPGPVPEHTFDPWNFRPDVAIEVSGAQLNGFKVEAVDGSLGKVTEASLAPDDSYLLVSTGLLGLGKDVLLPAGTVNHVDRAETRIYLDRTRDQVKSAPGADSDVADDPAHREALARFYTASY